MTPRDPKTFRQHFALDYFTRPSGPGRWTLLLSLAALLVGAGVLTAVVANKRWHSAFQAGPLITAHATFANDCAQCHTKDFATAARFLPGSEASTVGDEACLRCHDAGRHVAHQTAFTGERNQASRCAVCHREHLGQSLTRLPDATCTQCHADLQTDDGAHRFAPAIHHFGTDHPEFGAWRSTAGIPLADPAAGRFHFSHQIHLGLPESFKDVPPERLHELKEPLAKLASQQCAYCHQPESGGDVMRPVRFNDHCAACHELKVPPAAGTPEGAKTLFDQPLPHPGPNQSAADIVGVLVERYLRAGTPPASAASTVEPPVLRQEGEKAAAVERLARERALGSAALLFDQPKAGCNRCHVEAAKRGADGVPAYLNPRQHNDRWDDVKAQFPERLRHAVYADQSNRWFPLSRFPHSTHKGQACTDCHKATASTDPRDLLMPTINDCRACHNRTSGIRSDCLACHQYHDRSQERPRTNTQP